MFAKSYFPNGFFAGRYFPPVGLRRPAIGYPGPGGQYVEYVWHEGPEERRIRRRKKRRNREEEELLVWLLMEESDE